MCTSPVRADEFPFAVQRSDSSPPATLLTVEGNSPRAFEAWLSSSTKCFVMKGGTVGLCGTRAAPTWVSQQNSSETPPSSVWKVFSHGNYFVTAAGRGVLRLVSAHRRRKALTHLARS